VRSDELLSGCTQILLDTFVCGPGGYDWGIEWDVTERKIPVYDTETTKVQDCLGDLDSH